MNRLDFGDNPVASRRDNTMKESIRNGLPGTIKSIVSDKVMSEVIIDTGAGEVVAVITTRSVTEMGLREGDKVFALIKATNVSVSK